MSLAILTPPVPSGAERSPWRGSSVALREAAALRSVLVALRADLLYVSALQPTSEEIRRVCQFVLEGTAITADAEEVETLCLTLRRYVDVLVALLPTSPVDHWRQRQSLAARHLCDENLRDSEGFGPAVRLARVCRDLMFLVDGLTGTHEGVIPQVDTPVPRRLAPSLLHRLVGAASTVPPPAAASPSTADHGGTSFSQSPISGLI